jgi:hypothetical protein
MPDISNLTPTKISEMPDRLIALVHWDLHKVYREDSPGRTKLLVLLHERVFLEFTMRGLHHNYVNDLDKIATPVIESDIVTRILDTGQVFKPKEDFNVSQEEALHRWHAAIHDIWFSVKINRGLIEPPEDLINAHEIVVSRIGHHPIWDELDKPWEEAIKSFCITKSEDNLLYLPEILMGFPDSINIVPESVLRTSSKEIYIQPGISGTLRTVIMTKMLRSVEDSIEIQELNGSPEQSYNLLLARPGSSVYKTPISYDEVGFQTLYSISSQFCCLVGSIAQQKVSNNDADVLIKRGIPDWLFQHVASSLILSHDLGTRLHFLLDQGLGPTAQFEPLYDLVLELET